MNAINLIPASPISPAVGNTVGMGVHILDRMERAVAKVRERLLRAASALNAAGIAYAVVGGNAVATWVATIDEGAVRNTPDVDILVRRADLEVVTAALESVGFIRAELLDVVIFRDGLAGKSSDAVHLLFAGEKVKQEHVLPAPEIVTIEDPENYRVLALQSLVEMKLLSNRLKDRVHVRDLIGVGLMDASWLPKLHPVLAKRLQELLDRKSVV